MKHTEEIQDQIDFVNTFNLALAGKTARCVLQRTGIGTARTYHYYWTIDDGEPCDFVNRYTTPLEAIIALIVYLESYIPESISAFDEDDDDDDDSSGNFDNSGIDLVIDSDGDRILR